MSNYTRYPDPAGGIKIYPSVTDFPIDPGRDGVQAVAADTNTLYIYDTSVPGWQPIANPGAVVAITGLQADVSATGPGVVNATVNSVGGAAAADVATSVSDTQAATDLSTASTLMKRDASSKTALKGLKLDGATSGTLTIDPAAITTSYSVTMPAAQGAASTFLQNNGSGVLSWTTVDLSGLANRSLSNLTSPTALNQVLLGTLGAVGAPAYSFTGDTNTGMWSSGADTLNLSTGGSERIRIDSSGNVGIGISNPGQRLTVVSSGLPVSIRNTSASGYSAMAIFDSGSNEVAGFGYANASAGLSLLAGRAYYYSLAKDLIFTPDYNSASNSFILRSNGNFGIGTATPNSKLEVNGTALINGNTTIQGAWTGGFGLAQFKATSGALAGFSFASSNLTRLFCFSDENNSVVNFATSGAYGIAFITDTITGSSPVRMQITATGNVGIGTTTPTQLLDVNGGLRFQGGLTVKSIHAQAGTANVITVAVSDYYIGVDCSANAKTINLPAAATAGAGKQYVFKDESGNAATNNITIDPNGAELIDGAATYVMAVNRESVTILCDGTNWQII